MSGVIVLTASVCVCVSVCPAHSPCQTDGHTELDFGMEVKWKDIKVKFVGQFHRLKVKVIGSKNLFVVIACVLVLRLMY